MDVSRRPMRALTFALAAATATAVFTSTAGTSAAEPQGQRPVFENGMAMPVFTDSSTWVEQELWVTSSVDSDRDGEKDRIHIDVTRPGETETDDLDVPVVYEASPYYAGGNPITNHNVDHELYAPTRPGQGWPGAKQWGDSDRTSRDAGPGVVSNRHVSTWVPRGFAVVHAESIGSGESDGCPTTGDPNETAGAKAVVDWLNGRTAAVDAQGNAVEADWTTGQVGMIGTSYNGTLPNAVASTGVEGLEAIVPISAISSWYDYYRANGHVVAPGGYQGEDADVLAEYVYTRDDSEICKPVIEEIERDQDRVTGDYSEFWDDRNYLNDVDKVSAAVLVAHGLQDWNVKTLHAAQWYEALRAERVPHKIYWHQGGHGGAPPLDVTNRWFTRYLYDVQNGVEQEPRALIQREDGTLTNYPEWPDPGMRSVELSLTPRGENPTGGLSVAKVPGRPVVERFTDIPTQTAEQLAAAPDSEHGRVYTTAPLPSPVRISGTPVADLRLSFGQPAANVSVALVDLAPDGSVTRLITEGWRDPQNRKSLWRTSIVKPGTRYRLDVPMQPNDYVFPAGHRIGFVLLSTDHDYTIRPDAGAELALDTKKSRLQLPVVGGASVLPQ